MKRRALLAAAAGTVGAVGTAGCLQGLGTGTDRGGTTPGDAKLEDATTARTGNDDSGQSPGSGASRDDSREAGPDDPDWNSGVEPVETFAVGDRESVAFPNSNHPHSVAFWNRVDREREVRVDVEDPRALDSETVGPVSVPGGAVFVVELNVPAVYALAVAVDGDEFGSVVVDRSWFDCNHSTSRYALGERDVVDYGGMSTAVACAPPAVANTSLSVGSRDCGSENDEAATITYRDEAVAVDGTFVSGSACSELSLANATYDRERRTARLVVEADPQDEGGCVNCVGAIDYEATVDYDRDLPDHVAVVHRDVDGAEDVVTTASRNDDA